MLCVKNKQNKTTRISSSSMWSLQGKPYDMKCNGVLFATNLAKYKNRVKICTYYSSAIGKASSRNEFLSSDRSTGTSRSWCCQCNDVGTFSPTYKLHLDSSVVQCRTRNRKVAGIFAKSLAHCAVEYSRRQATHAHLPLSPNSIIWY